MNRRFNEKKRVILKVTWGMIGRVGRGSSKGVCRVSCKLWDQLGPVSKGGSMIPANFTTNS